MLVMPAAVMRWVPLATKHAQLRSSSSDLHYQQLVVYCLYREERTRKAKRRNRCCVGRRRVGEGLAGRVIDGVRLTWTRAHFAGSSAQYQ